MQTTLSDILNISQQNNTRDEITGILMYHDNLFFQVLEGEQLEVENCYYKRIAHDIRHSALSIMWNDVVERRTFSGGGMEYAGPDEIGKFTKNCFRSLADFKSDGSSASNINKIALELARNVFVTSKVRR